jgi:hypothetical protein
MRVRPWAAFADRDPAGVLALSLEHHLALKLREAGKDDTDPNADTWLDVESAVDG